MAALDLSQWQVTEDKVREAVRRIVDTVDPLAIIAFGSRARGDHRPDSDLDLAVIMNVPESEAFGRIPSTIFADIRMPVDLLPVSLERFERFRPWVSSVHNNIDREGIRLYERGTKPAGAAIIRKIC